MSLTLRTQDPASSRRHSLRNKTGAGGIRTPGTVLPVQRFSKPPHSTTLPPHPELKHYEDIGSRANPLFGAK